jgi:hypothetical protein
MPAIASLLVCVQLAQGPISRAAAADRRAELRLQLCELRSSHSVTASHLSPRAVLAPSLAAMLRAAQPRMARTPPASALARRLSARSSAARPPVRSHAARMVQCVASPNSPPTTDTASPAAEQRAPRKRAALIFNPIAGQASSPEAAQQAVHCVPPPPAQLTVSSPATLGLQEDPDTCLSCIKEAVADHLDLQVLETQPDEPAAKLAKQAVKVGPHGPVGPRAHACCMPAHWMMAGIPEDCAGSRVGCWV